MRRAAGILAVALLVLAAAVPAASASKREVITIPIDDSFTDDGSQCGFPLTFHFFGTARVTLTRNDAGLVVKETDHGKLTQEFSSPFGSFSFPSQQPSVWDYGAGAVVGSSVTITFHGLAGHVPGVLSSDAGFIQFEGVVEGFDEFGIPLVEFGAEGPTVQRGHWNTGEDIEAAICAGVGG